MTEQSTAIVQSAMNEPFSIGEFFDLGPTMSELRVKEGVTITPSDYAKALVTGFGMENCGAFVAANAASVLEAMGHENAVIQICAECRKSYKTVSNWITTIRFLAQHNIKPTLRFTIYQEVATSRLEDEKKLEILETAKEKQFSSTETRHLVQDARGGEKSEKPKPLALRYLTITEKMDFKLVEGVPAKEENVIVVDLENKKFLDWEDGEWKEIAK